MNKRIFWTWLVEKDFIPLPSWTKEEEVCSLTVLTRYGGKFLFIVTCCQHWSSNDSSNDSSKDSSNDNSNRTAGQKQLLDNNRKKWLIGLICGSSSRCIGRWWCFSSKWKFRVIRLHRDDRWQISRWCVGLSLFLWTAALSQLVETVPNDYEGPGENT